MPCPQVNILIMADPMLFFAKNGKCVVVFVRVAEKPSATCNITTHMLLSADSIVPAIRIVCRYTYAHSHLTGASTQSHHGCCYMVDIL
jgi:hypothetical protein